MKKTICALIVIGILLSTLAVAQTKEFVDTLNGFRLHQLKSVPSQVFGQPFQTGKLENGLTYEAFVIDQKHGCYMVFEYSRGMIRSIQYSGQKSKPFFKGLALGSTAENVLKKLGQPYKKVSLDAEYGEAWNYYQDQNYSIEIAPSGKLSSVKIIDNSARLFPEASMTAVDTMEKIFSQLRTKNKKMASSIIDPAIEIYLPNKNILAFNQSWETELKKDASGVYKFLFDKKKGVLALDKKPAIKYVENLRVMEKTAPLIVYKFNEAAPIKEIVLKESLGQWLIYEIACR